MEKIDKQAITEAVEILRHSEKKVTDKIPEKFMQFLYKNMDNEYNVKINFADEKWDEKIKSDTKVILALIYRDYIVTKEEREDLIAKEKAELEKEEKELREKYNPDNLFKKKDNIKDEEIINNMQLIEIKEDIWYKKIWKKIISIFGIKK